MDLNTRLAARLASTLFGTASLVALAVLLTDTAARGPALALAIGGALAVAFLDTIGAFES
jgi:hypothetical protein